MTSTSSAASSTSSTRANRSGTRTIVLAFIADLILVTANQIGAGGHFFQHPTGDAAARMWMAVEGKRVAHVRHLRCKEPTVCVEAADSCCQQ